MTPWRGLAPVVVACFPLLHARRSGVVLELEPAGARVALRILRRGLGERARGSNADLVGGLRSPCGTGDGGSGQRARDEADDDAYPHPRVERRALIGPPLFGRECVGPILPRASSSQRSGVAHTTMAVVDRSPRREPSAPDSAWAASAWPLVGRDAELRVLERTLREGAGAVVAGAPGVGKTRLLREAAATARDGGAYVERIVASRSAASIPLGAFAHLRPDIATAARRRSPSRRAAPRARAAKRRRATRARRG